MAGDQHHRLPDSPVTFSHFAHPSREARAAPMPRPAIGEHEAALNEVHAGRLECLSVQDCTSTTTGIAPLRGTHITSSEKASRQPIRPHWCGFCALD
jgi:hypothetical protein